MSGHIHFEHQSYFQECQFTSSIPCEAEPIIIEAVMSGRKRRGCKIRNSDLNVTSGGPAPRLSAIFLFFSAYFLSSGEIFHWIVKIRRVKALKITDLINKAKDFLKESQLPFLLMGNTTLPKKSKQRNTRKTCLR